MNSVGSWQLAVGSWQLAVGSWQLAVGSWQLTVNSECTIPMKRGFDIISRRVRRDRQFLKNQQSRSDAAVQN
ncbi:hypothetical protein IQ270_12040 [Microcoleus sp. LEGE 07076]|uniref:hypothetical protein n=1 Tax=Microcoleus sp. LEGE 07076 TaxID=915322 RepID=UPI001881AD08|nr:hypothetical protein [Microcoleus sp. LEGE 07076]MBE9185416.1 hypothetical protein [Microcoleus sp. LEGE 07076]